MIDMRSGLLFFCCFFYPSLVHFLLYEDDHLLLRVVEKNKGITAVEDQPSGRDSWTTATVQSTASAVASSNPTTSQSIDSFLTPSAASAVCTQQDYEILKARKAKRKGFT